MNLRVDSTFVEDDRWHTAAERYHRFLSEHESNRVLYLEIGVGWNTPSLIKFPFWQRTYANSSATFATLNQEPEVPQQIEQALHRPSPGHRRRHRGLEGAGAELTRRRPRRSQNMPLSLAEVSGITWSTSQCSTIRPRSSRRKMSMPA